MSLSPASDALTSTGPEDAQHVQHHTNFENVFRRRRTTRRSSHACLNCRRRKVRCNVIESYPCSNCKHYDVECGIPPRNIFRVTNGPKQKIATHLKGFAKTKEHEPHSSPSPTPTVEQDIPKCRQKPRNSDPYSLVPFDLHQPFNSLLGHISTLSREMRCLREQGAFAATPVVLILQAMTIHQLQMNSNNSTVQQEALRMFIHGKGCLKAMRDRYLAQGFATGYLDEMLQRSESFILEKKTLTAFTTAKVHHSPSHLEQRIGVTQMLTPVESTDNHTAESLLTEERLADDEDLRRLMGDRQDLPVHTRELGHGDVQKAAPNTAQSNRGLTPPKYHDSWQAIEFACQIEKDFEALLDTMFGAEQTA